MDDGRQRDNIKCNMLCYGCCVRHWRTWRKCRSDASIPPTRSSENVNERVLAIGIENVPQKVIVTYSGMKDASTRKIWPIAFYWQQWIKLTMLSNSYTTNIKRKREKWNERDVMTCNFFYILHHYKLNFNAWFIHPCCRMIERANALTSSDSRRVKKNWTRTLNNL